MLRRSRGRRPRGRGARAGGARPGRGRRRRPIRCASALAAVLDRERVDTLDDHHGLVFGDVAGGHRVPDRLVVAVQGVRELEAAFGVPLGLPGRRWPSSCRCRWHRASAPRSRRSAWWAWRSSSSVIWCRSAAPRRRCQVESRCRLGDQGPRVPEVGRRRAAVGRRRRSVAGDRVLLRCRRMPLSYREFWHRPPTIPGPEPASVPGCGQLLQTVSGALVVVVSTSSTTGGLRGTLVSTSSTTRRTPPVAAPFNHPHIARSCLSSRESNSVTAMGLLPSAHADTFCRDHLPPVGLAGIPLRPDRSPVPDRLNCGTELLDDDLADSVPEGRAWSARAAMCGLRRSAGRANQVAHALVEEHGVVPGNRVLLRGPNNPWLVACWFGVLKAGAVAVTTMPLLRPGELRTVAEIARIDLALCDHRFTSDLRPPASAVRRRRVRRCVRRRPDPAGCDVPGSFDASRLRG